MPDSPSPKRSSPRSSPARGSLLPNTPSQQYISAVRDVLRGLQPHQRGAVNRFWSLLRGVIDSQGNEITKLRIQVDQLSAATPGPASRYTTPFREPSTDSAQAIRDAVEQAIVTEAQLAPDASVTIEEICDLDPAWVLDFIKGHRDASMSNELGCWASGNVASHPTGYVKVNMRNTQKPGAGRKFNCAPFVHQLAAVAHGQGPLLRLTSDGTYGVSVRLDLGAFWR
jgi:hypothetical protein